MKTKKTEIILENPFVLDLRPYQDKWLSKFDSAEQMLKWFKDYFKYDKIPYDFTNRRNHSIGSSADCADINYSDLRVGHNLYWRRFKKNGKQEITPIKIIHKYQHIFFFESLIDGRKSYFDVGANDYNREKWEKFELPKGTFYPIEVLLPEYVEISKATFPDIVKITNV